MVVANILLLVDPAASGLDSVADDAVEGVSALALLLTLAGLVGVHLRQAGTYGALGAAGFVVALVGQAASTANAFTLNASVSLVTVLPAIVRFFVLALAILRRPALPHWIGFLLLVGFVAFWQLHAGDGGIAFDGAVWGLVGYALWSSWAEGTFAPSTQA